jgi:putative ABC transport system permease protein
MRSILRQFRRAPGRITASVFALALAVGAIGVLAIPTVSEGTLHEAVERDGLGDLMVMTTTFDDATLDAVGDLDDVAVAEGQAVAAVELASGFLTRMVGLDFDDQTMDVLQLSAGRLPTGAGEVVTTPSIGEVGDIVVANNRAYEIVGHGSTLWWSDSDVLFASFETSSEYTGGANRLVVTATDDGEAELRQLADEVRDVLQANGENYADFPVMLPDGSTPIDADIDQVSMLIGMLGVFAGGVALVLLASTTNTLITERTREVAVMRALGGRNRPLRRRLRRIAVAITGVALLIGLPLGVVISNLIARMVLEEFVGITPDVAVDWWVVGGSAVGALVAARLVAARAARSVTKLPLAEALRDRDGAPFGNRWTHRLLSRVPTGGLFGRIAVRTSARRPARTIAVVTQISAAVGAAFLVPTLATSVNDFNTATLAPWEWESVAVARESGLPFAADDDLDLTGESEAGIWQDAEIGDWEVDVYGFATDTRFFEAGLREGRWLEPASRQAMLSAGFAERRSIDVGDTVEVDLAGGPVTYEVVGTLDDAAVAVYVDRTDLAADNGAPGMANVVWSTSDSPRLDVDVPVRVSTAADLAAEDEAARDAIVGIFGAIGVIVAGVAALAVLSSMTVNLFERRHEFAAMQALGARRRRLRRLIVTELLPVGAAGVVGGLALGALGARGIIASFEASNAIDIGVTDAVGTIPFIIAGTAVGLLLVATFVVRSAGRRPVAVTLRGAA